MTGITKDELMQMAIEHGFKRAPVIWHHMSADQDEVIALANAILERAVVECEDTDIEEDQGGMSYYAQLGDALATRDSISRAVRALKINTGD